MDKPLKDWTFSEVQEYCKTQRSTSERCIACKIQKFYDKYLGRKGEAASPKYWDLSEKPRYTQQEVEDAKALARLIGNTERISRLYNGALIYGCNYLNADRFPSIKNGETVALDEIIGGAHV